MKVKLEVNYPRESGALGGTGQGKAGRAQRQGPGPPEKSLEKLPARGCWGVLGDSIAVKDRQLLSVDAPASVFGRHGGVLEREPEALEMPRWFVENRWRWESVNRSYCVCTTAYVLTSLRCV